MKPSREEVMRVVQECGLTECIDDAYIDRDDWKPIVERFAAAIYEAGVTKGAEDGHLPGKNSRAMLPLLEELAAERAVSDRLLAALKETVNRLQFANMRVDCESEIAAADSVITEVEAMRAQQARDQS